MDKLVRRWVVVLGMGFGFGTCLMAVGISFVRSNHGAAAIQYLPMCIAAGLFSGACLWHGLRLFKGRVLLQACKNIALDGGELTVPEPGCPYEVWIFCGVPFAYYRGRIEVASSRTGEIHNIKVPARNPLFYPVRANYTPIVWRAPKRTSPTASQCSIRFHLLPRFSGGICDGVFRTNDIETVTVLIKEAQPALRCRRGRA